MGAPARSLLFLGRTETSDTNSQLPFLPKFQNLYWCSQALLKQSKVGKVGGGRGSSQEGAQQNVSWALKEPWKEEKGGAP